MTEPVTRVVHAADPVAIDIGPNVKLAITNDMTGFYHVHDGGVLVVGGRSFVTEAGEHIFIKDGTLIGV